MGEQQTTTNAPASKCPHPEAASKRWGDPIGKERKAKLDKLAKQQCAWVAQPADTRGDSVFQGVRLTGADVFWLAVRTLAGSDALHDELIDASRRLLTADPEEFEKYSLSGASGKAVARLFAGGGCRAGSGVTDRCGQ
jgi:hypothetical protein